MTDAVRRRLLDSHLETITAVVDTGRTVARQLPDEDVTTADVVTVPLERLLDERELSVPLLSLLSTGADALGERIQGEPVPAPPYLVVTSRGPLCRGTLSDGSRLVIELELFAVDRQPRRYRFRDPTPEECLDVSCGLL